MLPYKMIHHFYSLTVGGIVLAVMLVPPMPDLPLLMVLGGI